jgi:hypothetical protein
MDLYLIMVLDLDLMCKHEEERVLLQFQVTNILRYHLESGNRAPSSITSYSSSDLASQLYTRLINLQF